MRTRNLTLNVICFTFIGLFLYGAVQSSTKASARGAKNLHPVPLNLSFKDLDADSGVLRIALFDSRKSYDNDDALATKTVRVKARDSISVAFEGVADGDYAIKVYHDADNDGTLDTNSLGMPIEKYAFSKDARAFFTEPDWSAAKFTLEGARAVREITLE